MQYPHSPCKKTLSAINKSVFAYGLLAKKPDCPKKKPHNA